MLNNLFKSILHNIGVAIVGFAFAFVGSRLDLIFGFHKSDSLTGMVVGVTLLVVGFLVRVWATFYFYQSRMKVISLAPQGVLLTSGPYRYSRNPLYVGGNICIFFGASLALGSTAALILSFLQLPLVAFMIRREEKQLERTFGQDWIEYSSRVRRWF